MFDEELLEELKCQERELQFSSFDLADAYKLGTMLREAGERAPKPVAVRIVLDGLAVYQSFLPGTGANNNHWMDRKQRTVEHCHTSSLRAAVERELSGPTEDWQKDEESYAFCGGGFPIVVNGVYHGAAIISGLPHMEDHRTLVQTLRLFLEQ